MSRQSNISWVQALEVLNFQQIVMQLFAAESLLIEINGFFFPPSMKFPILLTLLANMHFEFAFYYTYLYFTPCFPVQPVPIETKTKTNKQELKDQPDF